MYLLIYLFLTIRVRPIVLSQHLPERSSPDVGRIMTIGNQSESSFSISQGTFLP